MLLDVIQLTADRWACSSPTGRQVAEFHARRTPARQTLNSSDEEPCWMHVKPQTQSRWAPAMDWAYIQKHHHHHQRHHHHYPKDMQPAQPAQFFHVAAQVVCNALLLTIQNNGERTKWTQWWRGWRGNAPRIFGLEPPLAWQALNIRLATLNVMHSQTGSWCSDCEEYWRNFLGWWFTPHGPSNNRLDFCSAPDDNPVDPDPHLDPRFFKGFFIY